MPFGLPIKWTTCYYILLGLSATWAYSLSALQGPTMWTLLFTKTLALLHLSSCLPALTTYLSPSAGITTELPALFSLLWKPCQEVSSNPTWPPSHGKGCLSSLVWDISHWQVSQSAWGYSVWNVCYYTLNPLLTDDFSQLLLELPHIPLQVLYMFQVLWSFLPPFPSELPVLSSTYMVKFSLPPKRLPKHFLGFHDFVSPVYHLHPRSLTDKLPLVAYINSLLWGSFCNHFSFPLWNQILWNSHSVTENSFVSARFNSIVWQVRNS